MSHSSVSRARSHPCSACTGHGTFCSLPEETRAVFDKLKTSAAYAKGEVVFYEADPFHSVFAVCKGRIKLVTSSTEGRVLLLRFTEPGELLGLTESILEQATHQCTAIAAEPVLLAVIPREKFIRFVTSYPQACLKMTVAVSEQYKMAQRETKFLAFGGTSTSRIAHILLDQASARGEEDADGIHIQSHVTHSELAQSIGATRETVTRILGELRQRGIVNRTQDEIVIHNRNELTHLRTSLTALTTNCDGDAPHADERDLSIPQ